MWGCLKNKSKNKKKVLYGPLRYEDVHLIIRERMEEVVHDTTLDEVDRLWFLGAMLDLDNRVWEIVEERLRL